MNRTPRTALLALATLILAGCESTQYGSELADKPRPQPFEAGATTLKLPQDAPFNIVLPESNEKPLLNGKSDAACKADKGGAGSAKADVQTGGVAEAIFRVGHSIENATAQPVELTCKVRVAYELSVSASTPTAANDGVVGLRLYARDKHGRLLRTVPLVDHTSADGAVRKNGRDEVSIDLELAAGATLNLFVGCQARVDVPEERSASAAISLTELQMEISRK